MHKYKWIFTHYIYIIYTLKNLLNSFCGIENICRAFNIFIYLYDVQSSEKIDLNIWLDIPCKIIGQVFKDGFMKSCYRRVSIGNQLVSLILNSEIHCWSNRSCIFVTNDQINLNHREATWIFYRFNKIRYTSNRLVKRLSDKITGCKFPCIRNSLQIRIRVK